MMKYIYLPIVVFSIISAAPTYAQSTLPLQERCSAGAAQLVGRLDAVAAYTSHYNKNLDQCFARVGFYLGQIEEQVQLGNGRTITLKHPHWAVTLYRVFDNKILGACSFIGTSKQECVLGNTTPKTIEEFEGLVAPYMEE